MKHLEHMATRATSPVPAIVLKESAMSSMENVLTDVPLGIMGVIVIKHVKTVPMTNAS